MPIKPKTISFVSFESLTTSLWYNCTVLDLIPSPIITYFDMHKTSQCWSQRQKCCHNQYIGHNCKGISHKKTLGLHRQKQNSHYSKQSHIITRQSLKRRDMSWHELGSSSNHVEAMVAPLTYITCYAALNAIPHMCQTINFVIWLPAIPWEIGSVWT